MKITNVTQSKFSVLRDYDNLTPDTVYVIDGVEFGYTWDGEGVFWYDTMEELTAEHGN